jgi:hypothetical protein
VVFDLGMFPRSRFVRHALVLPKALKLSQNRATAFCRNLVFDLACAHAAFPASHQLGDLAFRPRCSLGDSAMAASRFWFSHRDTSS